MDALAMAPGIAPGRTIGKYQILHHMATGGMAEIYLARATGIERFQKLVVIKRILPAHAMNLEIRTMLLDEARIAATLHHGNIVQVFDIGEAGGEYFYCMEYLHGRDVSSVVAAATQRGHYLSEDQAFSIVLAVCAGLHYAHEKTDEHDRPLGIVHRDVSPTNIFVTYDGGVKLLDFGLVQATGRATESRSGALKGKLAYMSPEQCRAKPCDRRADVFALSILLWELTTGSRLFTGDCDFDFLTAILEKEIPAPSSVIPGYPRELERIVMKGLSRDPAHRYQTAEAMQLELEEYARDRKLRVSPITLRQLMEGLFADELASWHAARRAGIPLEEHIIDQVPLAVGSVSVVAQGSQSQFAPPRLPAPTKMPTITRRSRSPWLALTLLLFAGLGVGGYLLFGRGSSDPSTGANATETNDDTRPADIAPRARDTRPADREIISRPPVPDDTKPITPPADTKPTTPPAEPTTPPAAATLPTDLDPKTPEAKAKKPAPRPTRPVAKPKSQPDHDSLFPQ